MKLLLKSALVAGVFALALTACEKKPPDREQILALLDAMELAAEARDVDAFMQFIDKDYHDARARDRRQVRVIVHFQFRRNRELFIYKIIKALEISGDDAAAIVLAAVAGESVDAENWRDIRAELLRFDVAFTRTRGDWKVSAASWRRITRADFL